MKKINFSENLKKEIAQGATLLFLFMFVGFLAITKNKKLEYTNIDTPALTSSIISQNSFNNDCLDVWLKTNKEVIGVSLNSVVFRVKSFTDNNTKTIQIIKSNNPKQIGEESFIIETPNG